MSLFEPLPFSQASENNKLPILDVLSRHLQNQASLLEIGGGTGQHAECFAANFPGLKWQSSDVSANLDNLNRRIVRAELTNLPPAINLDVNEVPWKCGAFDVIYSANCLHIISTSAVECFFQGVGAHLNEKGLLLVYGPFKYSGAFTTDSNAHFDVWLKGRDPVSGVRDFEWVNQLANDVGLRLAEDNAMPANNQLLVWHKP
ncbi:MAG: DUF938 domain-containing protein [Proteobacteria bacterium]|nr:DUF938 domain-containing protein [Pseudomonadota bacterium]